MHCIRTHLTTSANIDGPHIKLGIYIGYSSPSIIKYLEPLTGDLFPACFANYIFNEDHFPALGGELYQKECQEINWNAEGISFSDPCITETELQVQRIIDLQNIAKKTCQMLSQIIKV